MCPKQYENLHTSILGWAKSLKKTSKPFQKHVQQRMLTQKHLLYINLNPLMSLKCALGWMSQGLRGQFVGILPAVCPRRAKILPRDG